MRYFSEEHRKKLSESHIGKSLSKETRDKMSKARKGHPLYGRVDGKFNPMYGKKHTEESKRKMSIIRKGKSLSDKTKKAMSNARMGNKNPAWKGGISSIKNNIRSTYKYETWRTQIFIRDSFTCKKCGKMGGDLEVHHIKSFIKLLKEVKYYLPLFNLHDGAMIYSPLWDINNGITLCKKCHQFEGKK